MIIDKTKSLQNTSNQFFQTFFYEDITVERVLSYIERTTRIYPSQLSKFSIENYFKFFSTLKQITPESLKKTAFPIYQEAKIKFIKQNLNKESGTNYFGTFFNFGLLFSNEKQSFIKYILIELIKNKTIFSQDKLFYEKLSENNFVDMLIEIIQENYSDFIFSKYNSKTSSFSAYKQLNLKDKIKEFFFEKHSEFFITYKQELLSCKNNNDYLDFKKKYVSLNSVFSLSELDAFICYKTHLFEECFSDFQCFSNSRDYPYFYDDETFYNFIECLNNYYCLFKFNKKIDLYLFTKSYNTKYSEILAKNMIKKMKCSDIISLFCNDFELLKDYIDSDFLMNIDFEINNNLYIEDIPVDVWCFLYSKNKLFTNRLLNTTKSKEGDAFFDYIDKIHAAFYTIDNLENF